MSAERLREAARLMRERAGFATPGPWVSAEQTHGEWFGIQSQWTALGTAFERVEAEHIASWHPAVALAVADWLDSVAGAMTPPGEPVVDAGRHINTRDEEHALAVADAYLGSES